jgi:hypothetical protein
MTLEIPSDNERNSRRVEDTDGTECVVSNLRGAFFVKKKVFCATAPGSWRQLLLMQPLARGDEHAFPLLHKIEWSSLYIPWYEPFNSFWCFWVKIRDVEDHRDDSGWEEREGGKYCDTYPLLKPTGSFFSRIFRLYFAVLLWSVRIQ